MNRGTLGADVAFIINGQCEHLHTINVISRPMANTASIDNNKCEKCFYMARYKPRRRLSRVSFVGCLRYWRNAFRYKCTDAKLHVSSATEASNFFLFLL